MTRLNRLLIFTFLESLATVLFERGVYFFTDERLGFSPATNLALALTFGAVYVGGALVSHGLSERVGEKRLLWAALATQLATVTAVTAMPGGAAVFAAAVVLGLCNGIKWPVVESYVGAGWSPREQAAAVGRFNVAWSSSVPLSLLITGPLVAWDPPALAPGTGIFVAAGLCSLIAACLLRPLDARPRHTPHDHPSRPSASVLLRWRSLLASSRWSMVASYSLLFVLAPLMPTILGGLGYGVVMAATLAAALDLARLASFVVLERWGGWHGRAGPVLAVVLLTPLSFTMILGGGDTATVLAGELLFGVAAGMTYYAALYYALVVKNASVDAGGIHEGLIGAGFFLGPLTGLASTQATTALGSAALGFALGVGPLVLLCSAGALWTLRGAGRQASITASSVATNTRSPG